MVQIVRCKACGFVLKENQLGDICPACGAKRVVFEPYDDKVSEKRRKILDFHIHPVMTHFSIGFALFIFLLTLITLFIPQLFRTEILNTIFILSLTLPIFTVFTMLSGMLDGKLRFKKLNTPHLVKKIIFGMIFLVLSLLLALVSFISRVSETMLIAVLFLSLSCVLCGGFLGKIGSSLYCAKLPD